MENLAIFIRVETEILILSTVAIIGYKMLTLTITMQGLLDDKLTGSPLCPERVQLLTLIVASGILYLSQVLKQSPAETSRFPAIPDYWAWIAAASNALYLGGKAIRLWSMRK